jgi:ParB-like chromosome segregation protein Spo0J
MLRPRLIPVDAVAVSAERLETLHPPTVRLLAADIAENGLKRAIEVREEGAGYVLLEGLHRLEAVKWLGEASIMAAVRAAPPR